MRQALPVALLLSIAFAGTADAAATSPPGVNLRWDQCYADGGVQNKTFACDTNVGSERLAMSFELAGPLPDVISIVMLVTLTSESPVLPAWWQMQSFGTCRQTAALSYNTLPPVGSVSCADWSAGVSAGGLGAYSQTYTGAANARQITAAAAVPAGGEPDLVAGLEYSLGTLGISHTKTTGLGACAGCSTPVCLLFSNMEIESLVDGGFPTLRTRLTHAANYSGSAIVGWQNGYVLSTFPPGFNSAGLFFPAVITSCVPYSVTASKPSTWGAVKSLYR